MSSDTFSKLTWHKRTHGHKFTGAEFRVLMSIFDHSSADGTNSHPGIRRMMDETGYGKAAVSTAVTQLKARGWIHETRKGSGVSGNASVFELVRDAPKPPSSSPPGEQPIQASSSPGVDQPSEVVRLERTSSSSGANQVVRLEQSPSDPDIRSGSDPFTSDQEEVRCSPNHPGGFGETASYGRSLPDAGSEAPASADGGAAGTAQGEAASLSAAEQTDPWGSAELASGSIDIHPFAITVLHHDDEPPPDRRRASKRRQRSFGERMNV
ncbi:MarR family transcriptional regulator [Williamsia sp. R60]